MENPTVRDAVENCRYCFMCRHAGTAFRATKRDALTARGRALQLSRVLDGFAQWTAQSAETMFEDPIDGLSRELCAFHWPEDLLIRHSRELISKTDLIPKSVRSAIDAMAAPTDQDWKPSAEQTGTASPVLFLTGWAARRYAKELIEDQIAVLEAGFGKVRMLEDERAAAAAALFDLGQGDKAAKLSAEFAELITKTAPQRIVTGCSHTLRVLHGETGGPDLSEHFKVQHLTEAFEDLLVDGKLKLQKRELGTAGLHDAEHLARSRGLIDAPRAVASAVSTKPLREFEHHGAKAESAGAGAAMFMTHPDLTAAIADMRLRQAAEVGIETVITVCPHDYIALSARAADGRRVEDISQLVRRAAGL